MADSKLTLVLTAKDLASGQVNKLQKALGGVNKAAHNAAGSGLKKLAGGIVDLAKSAVLGAAGLAVGLVGGLLAATKAAADEQVGIVRLNAALKANVAGFKGNTDAIEKAVTAGLKLGFTDDAQRMAMAQLIPVTKNVKQALSDMSLAQNVARARGIDLASATAIVIKAQNGNVGALKKLGIVVEPVTKNIDKLRATTKNATPAQIAHAKALDKAATATKALGAIQKATSGQAAAYGNSEAGAWQAIKVTVGEVVEQLGTIFLPIMKQVAFFIRDNVIPVLVSVVKGISDWVANNQPLITQVGGALADGIKAVGGFIADAVPKIVEFGGKLFDAAKKIAGYVVPKVQAFIGTLTNKGGVIDSVTGVVGPIMDKLIPAFGAIVDALFGKNGLIPKLGELAAALWGGGTGPLAMAVKGIGTGLSMIFDAANFVIIKLSEFIDWISKNKELMATLKVVADAIAWGFHLAQLAVGFLIDRLNELLAWIAAHTSQLKVLADILLPGGLGAGGNLFQDVQAALGGGPKAGGGPVLPGGVYTVGENGKETLVMGASGGRVIPDGGAGARGSRGGGVTVNASFISMPSAGQIRTLVDMIDGEVFRRLATAPASKRG